MHRSTKPLFSFDPGWLFIAAGLAVCASGVLLPAQSDLQALQRQLELLRSEETQAYARLKAHADFLDEIDRLDPGLVKRLAAAQLNMIPKGDKPVLLAAANISPVTDWIDATVNIDIRPPKPVPVSTLSRLANGPHRLWMFGAGIMCVFVGLLLGPGPSRPRRIVLQADGDDDALSERDEHVAIAVVEMAEADTETGAHDADADHRNAGAVAVLDDASAAGESAQGEDGMGSTDSDDALVAAMENVDDDDDDDHAVHALTKVAPPDANADAQAGRVPEACDLGDDERAEARQPNDRSAGDCIARGDDGADDEAGVGDNECAVIDELADNADDDGLGDADARDGDSDRRPPFSQSRFS